MARKYKKLLGVDVGATGIKGAIVDIATGEFVTERVKISTPHPATPTSFARVIREIGKALDWKEGKLVGCGFPSVVQHGVTHSAANISDTWIGFKAEKFLSKKTNYEIALVNDADAAGMAEIRFGNVADRGTVLLLTIGTGIGSALFCEGQLIPNTELGHMPYVRSVAEDYVSNRARKDRKLSMRKWAEELNVYLKHVNRILTLDLIILGGGISKKFDQYEQYIDPGVKVVPAKLRNNAGITGAALYAISQ